MSALTELAERRHCLHLEKKIIRRISRGGSADKRPDLVLWICHLPLESFSGIQCPVIVRGTSCPLNGPYSSN